MVIEVVELHIADIKFMRPDAYFVLLALEGQTLVRNLYEVLI